MKYDEERLQLSDRCRNTVRRRTIFAASAALFPTHGVISTAVAEDIEPILQPTIHSHKAFMERAFEMPQQAIDLGDQAYGAVIVRDMMIIGQSWSRVILD